MTTTLLIFVSFMVFLFIRVAISLSRMAKRQNKFIIDYIERKKHNYLNNILSLERCPNHDYN